MRPTEERIKELWEWCGLCMHELRWSDTIDFNTFKLPDGRGMSHDGNTQRCVKCGWGTCGCFLVPEVSLDNLYQYAVPQLEWARVVTNDAPSGDRFFNGEVEYCGRKGACTEEDPALALFWAIYKVIDGDNTPEEH